MKRADFDVHCHVEDAETGIVQRMTERHSKGALLFGLISQIQAFQAIDHLSGWYPACDRFKKSVQTNGPTRIVLQIYIFRRTANRDHPKIGTVLSRRRCDPHRLIALQISSCRAQLIRQDPAEPFVITTRADLEIVRALQDSSPFALGLLKNGQFFIL